MANERETENIVRDHFRKDTFFKENKVTIEEQSSDNPRITKLLKNASKRGTGIGKPEFLISVKGEDNLLIVIECKADILKHESASRENFADYAVDGVLLYSSYLSKEFDVLSIAVSGVKKENIKVSYFIQRKKAKKSEQIFGNTLISINDIICGLKDDEATRNEKYENLLDYSRILNDDLHELKIKEDKRSLLISGILLSLNDRDFYREYDSYTCNQDLADEIVSNIKKQLKGESLEEYKIKTLMENYSFIKSHPSIINTPEKKKSLKKLIKEIDDNINGYSRTYKYYDILGQFYIEFLRYSNADKGLGIVLTPPHITEFFTSLVSIDKEDIIYDNCAGTGGFLVSAMKKMIEQCSGDKKKEKTIKEDKLFGVEYQPEIYPLSVSNMFLHGDGKSNIIAGDCFDGEVISKIKQKKPTVGLLNPPYKSKKEDTEELQFVLNNLECLKKYGRCVAIVPMSCALADSGDRLRLKKELLAKHTLKAALSMPNELFHNSKVSVVTSILVFEAHVPHPENKKTFFGYFKDDGFYKRKLKGRFDYDKKWDSIKEEWLDLYTNSTEKLGYSVMKKVNAEDEWCAEAYMETDYSLLSEDDFEKTIRKYFAFNVANNNVVDWGFMEYYIKAKKQKITSRINRFSQHNFICKLMNKNWEWFNLNDWFRVTGTKSHTKIQIQEYGMGEYPYVVTSAQNNGIEGYYGHYTEEGGVFTIDSATVGSCFYQSVNFSASDHVEKLIPQFDMNVYIALFIQSIINKEQFRYGYGRKFSQARIKETKIKLPADDNGMPDWQFMEDYIKSLPYSSNL